MAGQNTNWEIAKKRILHRSIILAAVFAAGAVCMEIGAYSGIVPLKYLGIALLIGEIVLMFAGAVQMVVWFAGRCIAARKENEKEKEQW